MEHFRLEISYDEQANPVGFSLIRYDEVHEPEEYICWPCVSGTYFILALTEAWEQIGDMIRAAGGEQDYGFWIDPLPRH